MKKNLTRIAALILTLALLVPVSGAWTTIAEASSSTNTQLAAGTKVTVTATSVHLRKTASNKAATICSLKKGATLSVKAVKGNWLQVTDGKHTGYVYRTLLTAVSAAQKESVTLLVYSGAGLKKPMEDIKKVYEQKNNIHIEYIYAGSAQLLAQTELSGKGDVLITGSMDSYEVAKKKGLVKSCSSVAYHIPAIAVPKGNPAGIKTLADMAKPGVKVALGDEKANAVGVAAQEIIKKTGLDGINTNTVVKTATVNELAIYLASGNVDAAIITKDNAVGNKDIEVIDIPADQNSIKTIPISVLSKTKHASQANAFAAFVASPEGKAIFGKDGFTPIK